MLAKFWAGTLAATRPSRAWAGQSNGATCDGCDQLIAVRAIEYEVHIIPVGVFRVHGECFDIWNRERTWYLGHTNHGHLPRPS